RGLDRGVGRRPYAHRVVPGIPRIRSGRRSGNQIGCKSMTARSKLASVLLLFLSCASAPALAHHPVLAKFDADRPFTLTGRLTHIDWANPHVHLFVNVGEGADAASWAIELASTVELERSGWSPETLSLGEVVTV